MDKYTKLLKKEALSNRKIFWDIEDIEKLSDRSIVERVLVYGNIEQFRNITKDLESFKKVYKIIKTSRNSLSPIVENYVDKYVKYHSQRGSF